MNIYSFNKMRGVTLIDALVAMAVGGIGLLALAIFQADLLSTSSESRTRAEAIHLAQQKMEQLRDVAVKTDIINTSGNLYVSADRVYDQSTTYQGINSTFTIGSVISGLTVGATYSASDAQYVTAKVTVGWNNSENIAESVFVASLIAWDSPTAAAARGDITAPDDLLSAGTFAAPPTGGGRMAEPGEALLANAFPSNGDGTIVYSDGEGNYQLVADEKLDGYGLIPVFVSDEPILKLSGNISSNNLDDLTILRVLVSDFGFCIYNEDGSTFSGSTGAEYDVTGSGSADIPNSGDFNCYVSASWHGNLGVLNKAGENFCSATHRYYGNCEILDSFFYVDATGNDTCPWTGSPDNGLIGELTSQNFEINNGGCEIGELIQPSVVGSVGITGNPKPYSVAFSVDSVNFTPCTVTRQGGKVQTFKCVAPEFSTVEVQVLDEGGNEMCKTEVIYVLSTEVTRNIANSACGE